MFKRELKHWRTAMGGITQETAALLLGKDVSNIRRLESTKLEDTAMDGTTAVLCDLLLHAYLTGRCPFAATNTKRPKGWTLPRRSQLLEDILND